MQERHIAFDNAPAEMGFAGYQGGELHWFDKVAPLISKPVGVTHGSSGMGLMQNNMSMEPIGDGVM